MRHSFNEEIRIGERVVGKDHPVFITAEAGVAHFGSLDKAKRLVDLAASGGADAVKFQVFNTEAFISKESAEWRKRYKAKELPEAAYVEIQAYCKEKHVLFFATAHDESSLDFLDRLNVSIYKVGSGEVRNWPFLEKVAMRGKPLFLSTGMYTLEDVGKALDVIYGAGNRNVVVMHCVTLYPTPPSEVNLRAMRSIGDIYGVPVGYSDHTRGFHFALAAVTLGARAVEKHITLDFGMPDAQDWKVSCGPEDLSLMVSQIREIEAGLGTGKKDPSPAELSSLEWASKSVVAARAIPAGRIISHDDLAFKRPGTGIRPSELSRILGRSAISDIAEDSVIRWEMIS